MDAEFERLFSPIHVGRVRLPNRICSTSHATGYCVNGLPTDRLIAYHALRARGGAGMIVLEGASVHPSSPPPFSILCLHDERVVPGLKRLAAEVHQFGTKVFAQLIHHGAVGHPDYDGTPLWSPSGIRPEPALFSHHSRPLTGEAIAEIVQAFARASRLARMAGLDGVEISAAQGVLIGEFWSPLSNLRIDQYGGSLENRMRFSLEIVEAIRHEVGNELALGFRLTMDEMVEGGLDLPQMLEIARRLAATGQVDYLSVKGSSYFSLFSAAMQVPPMYVPLGCFVYASAMLKREVPQVPVIAATRINEPRLAEKILANGEADIIGMCRALIADPYFPQKVRERRLEDIQLCIACNQGCIGNLRKGLPVTCIQNPSAGREIEMAELRPADRRRKVIVVGGGPAGLEAARVSALRGHAVTLYERSSELGGQVLIAARAPLRDEFAGSVRYLARQVRKCGVILKMKTEATAAEILAAQADVVIVATGARAVLPDCPEIAPAQLMTAESVLAGEAIPGQRVVVVDDFGDQAGLSTAEALLDLGREVLFVTRLSQPGANIDDWTWVLLYQRTLSKGLQVRPLTSLHWAKGQRVMVKNVLTEQSELVEPVDTVILSGCRQSNSSLYDELKGRIPVLHLIGDALSPRQVTEAVLEGARIGRSI